MANSKKNILNDMIQFLDALYWYLDKYLDKQSKKHFWFSKGITELGLVLPIFVLILIGITVAGHMLELSDWFPYLLCFWGMVPMSLLIYYSIREKRIMAKCNYRNSHRYLLFHLRYNCDSFGFCADHKISIATFIKTNL